MKIKNWQISKFYCFTQIRRSIINKLKFIMMLIPIFSIILLFATIQDLPSLNQKLYLNNCKYSSLVFSNEPESNALEYFKGMAVAEPKYGGNSYHLNIFSNKNSINLENSLFCNKNIIKNTYIDTQNQSTIMLSYNALKSLNIKVGDKINVSVDVKNSETNDFISVNFRVIGYTKPFYGDLYENDFNNSYGLAYVNLNSADKEKLYSNCEYKYVSFDGKKVNNADRIISKSDQKIIAATVNKNYYLYLLAFPGMSVVLIFLIIKNEFKYMLKTNKRTYNIYSMLGITKNQLEDIYVFEFMFSIVIASFTAVMCYRYILMELYIKQYVPSFLFWSAVIVCILLGFVVTRICIKSERKKEQYYTLENAYRKE